MAASLDWERVENKKYKCCQKKTKKKLKNAKKTPSGAHEKTLRERNSVYRWAQRRGQEY